MKEKKQLNCCKEVFVVVYLGLPICVKKQCFQLLLFFLLVYVGSTPVCWISFAQ